MAHYREAHISAKDEDQANLILNTLLKEKLVTGGLLFIAPARFLWQEKLVDLQYFNISAFTIEKNQKQIIETVKKVTKEELPMVWFTEIEGNEELLNWIDDILD
jgi:uncharacterized protein involved in tolerance to divalent cations